MTHLRWLTPGWSSGAEIIPGARTGGGGKGLGGNAVNTAAKRDTVRLGGLVALEV
jgi:hypothetical protein